MLVDGQALVGVSSTAGRRFHACAIRT